MVTTPRAGVAVKLAAKSATRPRAVAAASASCVGVSTPSAATVMSAMAPAGVESEKMNFAGLTRMRTEVFAAPASPKVKVWVELTARVRRPR